MLFNICLLSIRVSFPNGLFPLGFATKILYTLTSTIMLNYKLSLAPTPSFCLYFSFDFLCVFCLRFLVTLLCFIVHVWCVVYVQCVWLTKCIVSVLALYFFLYLRFSRERVTWFRVVTPSRLVGR